MVMETFVQWNCQMIGLKIYGDRAIDHFGRTTEPKHLTEQNAWTKDYDWRIDEMKIDIIFVNKITKEQRPLTEDQYNDTKLHIKRKVE